MTLETNIAAVMLTLNESDTIIDTLDSTWPIFDELVLVDGGSSDGTVELAEEWAAKRGIPFDLLESSERQYLLEGPGCQRRRGEELVEHCEYTLALDADVEVEVHDEAWFAQEFEHYGYAHTRVLPSGAIQRDFRLHRPDPPDSVVTEGDEPPRWRGIIHEELMSQNGAHLEEYYQVQEAPMTHYQQRHGAMDSHTVLPHHQKRLDTRVGGNGGWALKKQHYLLKRALGTDMQREYLTPVFHQYYQKNKAMVNRDWRAVADQFDLPQNAWHGDDPGFDGDTVFQGWDVSSLDPVMDHRDKSLGDLVVTEIEKRVGSPVRAGSGE